MSLVLGLETSCDETAAAVVDAQGKVLSNVIASQVDLHQQFGGVVPELAARQHVQAVVPVVEAALDQAQLDLSSLDAVAVTQGPGLVGALLVGVMAAKTLAWSARLPLVPVNHLDGHFYAAWLQSRGGEQLPSQEWPKVGLIVSGGHSDVVLASGPGDPLRVLGRTRDDAAGEAFDKTARLLGLDYPGGPAIQRAAQDGDPQAIDFPRALQDEDTLDVSFSGLKTAVAVFLEQGGQRDFSRADIAASFQAAVVEVLVQRAVAAVERFGAEEIIAGGGVAANSLLRQRLKQAAAEQGCSLCIPPPVFCTDNAAMIAAAAHWTCSSHDFSAHWPVDLSLDADPSLPFGVNV